MNCLCSINTHAFHKVNAVVVTGTLFPTTNLMFDFSTLTGTSTTTSGANLTTWTDTRTGLVASRVTSVYHTDVTINGYPTVIGQVNAIYGNNSTPQNSWTFYYVFRNITGISTIMYSSTTNNIRIQGGPDVATENVAWMPSSSASSGGLGAYGGSGHFVPAGSTNYIVTIICSGSSITSTSPTLTMTYRINGVDKTPAINTSTVTNSFFYVYNATIGIDSGGYLGEQILYSTNHSLATAQTMEQYLSYKWGIGIGVTPTVASSSPYSN